VAVWVDKLKGNKTHSMENKKKPLKRINLAGVLYIGTQAGT